MPLKNQCFISVNLWLKYSLHNQGSMKILLKKHNLAGLVQINICSRA